MPDGVNYDYCEQLEIGDEEQSSDLMQLHQPLTHRIGPLASGPHSAWARLGLGAIMRDTRSDFVPDTSGNLQVEQTRHVSSRDAETGHVSRRVAGVILPAGGRSSSVLSNGPCFLRAAPAAASLPRPTLLPSSL